MSQPKHPSDAPSAAPPGGRRPYRKPAILSCEPMEVVAAVCSAPGKADFAACPSGPITS